MAGERKGKTYEAIVFVILEQLKKKGKFKGDVFWNKTPKGMTIEPDLVVGNDIDHPSHIFLITHSGSAKNSDMKFWRNMGELAEAKTFIATIPHVFNIAFDSVIKKDLKKILAAAFDGQLIVGDTKYGGDIQTWVDQNQAGMPTKADDKADDVANHLAKDSKFRKLVTQLAKDIELLIQKRRPELDQLWKMERSRKSGKAPIAKDTFMRRGIGKLLITSGSCCDYIERSGKIKESASESLRETLVKCGLAKKSLAGIRVSDAEMLWPLISIESGLIKKICFSQPREKMWSWIEPLYGLAAIDDEIKYISDNWTKLTEPKHLYERLKICHAKPSFIAPKKIPSESKWVWLFHLLIELIKLNTRTRTGYGLAKLISDLEKHAKDSNHKKTVQDIVGTNVTWRAGSTLGLGLTDWHSTPSKQHFPLYDDDLARVAVVMANRLTECSPPDVVKDSDSIVQAIVQSNLETKIVTYRLLQPVETMIEIALDEHGLDREKLSFMEVCFSQMVKSSGIALDPRSGGTTVIRSASTLINWQSVSDAGRDHKKKELCGRVAGLRYAWDPKGKRFIKRPSIKKLILVLDGTWRQEDLDTLCRAGWDEIFYPDEMDGLVKAIV